MPTDGRITSLGTIAALSSTDLVMVVSPGNASSGINYRATVQQIANFIGTGSGGTGTPGGTTTQVQFNNAGAFDGSPALTWVGPNLRVGTVGTVGGLNVVGQSAGGVTFNAVASGAIWTFVLPPTAGTSGLPLVTDGLGTTGWTTLLVGGGGVGLTSYSTGDILYASNATTLARLAAGTSGWPLLANGSTSAPSWQQVISAINGGTGQTTFVVGDLLMATTATSLIRLAAGTAGWFLKSQGLASTLVWAAIGGGGDLLAANNLSDVNSTVTSLSNLGIASSSVTAAVLRVTGPLTYAFGAINLATSVAVTGVLAAVNGGIGAAALTGVIQGTGTSYIVISDSNTVNQVLRVTGTATYGWGALNLASSAAITGRLPFANLSQGDPLSVLGVAGAATADVASIVAASNFQVLHRANATTVAFGAVSLDQSAAVTGTLAVSNGGVGLAAYSTGDILYASNATTLARLAATTANFVLASVSSTSAPKWLGNIPATVGGVGITAYSTGDILYASNATTLARLAAGTAGFGLVGLGTTTAPSYQAVVQNGTTSLITVGYTITPYNGTTVSTGTFTPVPANGNYQYYTNAGAHTFAVPTADCAIDVLITNTTGAGAVTFTSAFTVSASVGDSLTTTSANKFIISVRRINAVSTYTIKALQ